MARSKSRRSRPIEGDRQQALDALIRQAPPIDEADYREFLKEMAGPKSKRGRTSMESRKLKAGA